MVIRVPPRSPLSTATTPSDRPLMMRLRTGKFVPRGRVPGGYSEIRAPAAATSSYKYLLQADISRRCRRPAPTPPSRHRPGRRGWPGHRCPRRCRTPARLPPGPDPDPTWRPPSPIRGTGAGTHHTDGGYLVKGRQLALVIEQRRRVGDVLQAVGVLGVLDGEQGQAQLLTLLQDQLSACQALVLQGLAGPASQASTSWYSPGSAK